MHGVSWRFFEHPGRSHMNAFPLHQSCLASGSTCHLPRDKPSQLLCCMHAQGTQHWALAMVAVALPGGQLMSQEPGANCAYKKKMHISSPCMHAQATQHWAWPWRCQKGESSMPATSRQSTLQSVRQLCAHILPLRECMLDVVLEPLSSNACDLCALPRCKSGKSVATPIRACRV